VNIISVHATETLKTEQQAYVEHVSTNEFVHAFVSECNIVSGMNIELRLFKKQSKYVCP
jgi:hypothetical protein